MQFSTDMNLGPLGGAKLLPTVSDWILVTILACLSLGITFTPIRSIGIYLLGIIVLISPIMFGFRGFLVGLALCTSGMFHVNTALNFLVSDEANPTLLSLPGFYVTLPDCLSIGTFISTLSRHRELLSATSVNARIHLLLVMLLIAVPFVLIGALNGRGLGLYNWANGLRGLLPILILIYPLACLNRAHVAPLARWFFVLLVINGIAWGLIGSVGHGFFLMQDLDVSPGIASEDLQHRINITRAIKFKLYDRMMVWMSALSVLKADPLQLATGRPLPVLRGGEWISWNAGAHNVFLEWLLNLGIIPGLWLCIFTVGCLVFIIRFGRRFRHDKLAVWASLAGLSVIPGLIMGQYPIQSVCGFAFWLVIGLCMKLEAENAGSKKRWLPAYER